MRTTEVCIVGAGPAGSTLAHFLAKEKVPHIILDKAQFPRDKICGDGITVDVLNVLKRLNPDLLEEFTQQDQMMESWGFSFHGPSGTELRYDFKKTKLPYAPFYTSRRLDLDNFLLRKLTDRYSDFHSHATVKNIARDGKGFIVSYFHNGVENQLRCKLLIGAEGEKPIVTKQLGMDHYREKSHLIGAVRVYYRNVQGFNPNGHLEFFFDNKLLPGYFWAFPLTNNEANVGLGMVSSMISKKRANLKSLLGEVIDSNPRISEMFEHAEALESPKGWGLPLITKKRRIAGLGFALIGDAAGMIEPFTGKGIGPGMMSARICSEHIVQALVNGESSLHSYEDHMYRYYNNEIRAGYALQKSLRYPIVLNNLLTAVNFSPIKEWSHRKMLKEWSRWI